MPRKRFSCFVPWGGGGVFDYYLDVLGEGVGAYSVDDVA
jgi:hypothetical protein